MVAHGKRHFLVSTDKGSTHGGSGWFRLTVAHGGVETGAPNCAGSNLSGKKSVGISQGSNQRLQNRGFHVLQGWGPETVQEYLKAMLRITADPIAYFKDLGNLLDLALAPGCFRLLLDASGCSFSSGCFFVCVCVHVVVCVLVCVCVRVCVCVCVCVRVL